MTSYQDDLEKRVKELEGVVARQDKELDASHKMLCRILMCELDPMQGDKLIKMCKEPLTASAAELRKALSKFYEMDWEVPDFVYEDDDEYIEKDEWYDDGL